MELQRGWEKHLTEFIYKYNSQYKYSRKKQFQHLPISWAVLLLRPLITPGLLEETSSLCRRLSIGGCPIHGAVSSVLAGVPGDFLQPTWLPPALHSFPKSSVPCLPGPASHPLPACVQGNGWVLGGMGRKGNPQWLLPSVFRHFHCSETVQFTTAHTDTSRFLKPATQKASQPYAQRCERLQEKMQMKGSAQELWLELVALPVKKCPFDQKCPKWPLFVGSINHYFLENNDSLTCYVSFSRVCN